MAPFSGSGWAGVGAFGWNAWLELGEYPVEVVRVEGIGSIGVGVWVTGAIGEWESRNREV